MSTEQIGNENALESQGTSEPQSQDQVTVEELKEQLNKANELANNYKIRAEKAEKGSKELTKATATKKESNELDYGQKAFLKASGFESSEFDFVQSELKESGLELDKLIENSYFKQKLQEQRELQATENANPTSGKSANPATDTLEYWLSKPFNEVPKEWKSKVVNAKVSKDKKQGMFYNG